MRWRKGPAHVVALLALLAMTAAGCRAGTGSEPQAGVDDLGSRSPDEAEDLARWGAAALGAVEAEVAAGQQGVSEALAYLAPDVTFDDRAVTGALVHGRDRLSDHLVQSYGLTLDEFDLQGLFVEAGGALVQAHVTHATGLRGPADVLQRRVYGPEGVMYARNDVSVATLRRRAGPGAGAPFEPWETLAQDYLTAWSSGDAEAATRLYAPEAVVIDTVTSLEMSGRSAISRQIGGAGGRSVLTLALIPGSGDSALYLDDRLPQLAGTLGVVYHQQDGRGCRATVAVQLLVSGGRITAERRYHDVASARRCFADLADGWWAGLPAPSDRPVTATLQVGGHAVEVRGSTPGLDGLVLWALGRFEAAGLEPPPLTSVTFAGATGRCAGVAGRARRHAGGTDLTLCFDESSACADASCSSYTLAARVTVLHELAHAWEHAVLDDRLRAQYVRATSLPAWNEAGVPWAERGVERAAETLMWGLMDEPLPLPRIGDPPCPTLHREYHLLTGLDPPHPAC